MARRRSLNFKRLSGTWWIWLICLGAALWRLWRMESLPPGLTAREAQTGLSSLNFIHHHQLWSAGITPLNMVYSLLSALPIAVGGPTVFTLRLVAVIASTLTVAGVYCWLKDWWGERQALVGAVITASVAWSVNLGRVGVADSLVPLAMVWWLWLAGRVATRRSRPLTYLVAATLAVMLYISPALWWFNLAVLVWVLVRLGRRQSLLVGAVEGSAVWLILALPAFIWSVRHHHQLWGLLYSGGHVPHVWSALSLFFAAGGDWQLTSGGQPLLNAFFAIMLILGSLIAIIRWRELAWLLALWFISLLAGASDWSGTAAQLALGLIPVIGLVTLGISTMLDRWYVTFPINSAARSVGRLALIALLALTIYQGYVQYFVAFADSSETHQLYHEDYLALATEGGHWPTATIVADPAATPVVQYLNYPDHHLFSTPAAVGQQKLQSAHYLIGQLQEDQMIPLLKSLDPGGRLQAHTSPFDGQELFFSYTVKP